MGGVAIRVQSPSVRRPPHARVYRDLDLVAHDKDVGALRKLLEVEGYVGDKLFNAIHGAQRLVYGAPDGRWSVDVVIDSLSMSHTLDLKDRLRTDGVTLDLADLLLTKLQIWETNGKDRGDVLCLLADHPLAAVGRPVAGRGTDGAPGAIDLVRLRSVLAADWGFCHTVERNLRDVAELWATAPVPEAPYPVDAQVARPPGRHRRGPEVDRLAGPIAGRRAGPLVRGPRGGPPLAFAGVDTARDQRLAPVVDRPLEVIEDLVVGLLEGRDHLEDEGGLGRPRRRPAPRAPAGRRSGPRHSGPG